jgi:hypothetical protein
MNYAIFGEWVRDRVEELVGFGVPRDVAEQAMHYVEVAGVAGEAESRRESQLLLDFKVMGGVELARRHGVSERTIRTKRAAILRKNQRQQLVARLHEA